jgi:hypothetical protein
VIELLAITDDATPPRLPLRAVRSGPLSALCAPASEQEVTPEVLWRHDALLEELMQERDLLPVRFGTLVADEQAVARAVAERSQELLAQLEHVRGAVELALRVNPTEQEPPGEPGTGRDYLRAKIARSEIGRALHEPLAAIARDSDVQPGRELLRVAYLVDRDAVDDFVAMVRRLQQANPRLALLCTGPWPPYSFAERREQA